MLLRIGNSERVGTISQKVPTDWMEIARMTSSRICKEAIEINANDALNMDETFILSCQSSRILARSGTKRIGAVVQIENEKNGFTVAVTAG